MKESKEPKIIEQNADSQYLTEILQQPDIINATSVLLSHSLVDRGIINQQELRQYLSLLMNPSLSPQEKAGQIRSEILHIDQSNSKYNVIYNSYTSTTRVSHRVDMIAPYLKEAKTIIDVGTGNGRIAVDLVDNHNKFVIATDVHNYLSDEAKKHPGIKFMQTDHIDLAPGSADGAFCSLVLHHVENDKVQNLLGSVNRSLKPGGKFIILEETPPPNNIDVVNNLSETSLDQVYHDIGEQKSKKLLGIMDYISNWVANGIFDVPLPLNFHTINEWNSVFRKSGFTTQAVDYFGVPPLDKKFTPVPGARFILRKK